jgi:hypothetical protein
MTAINNFIRILIIILIPFILCSAQSKLVTSQQKNNHNLSKQLIVRYNKLRFKKNLPLLYHDSLLDNVVSKIQLNKEYKNSTGSYKEDSIRLLLYRSGIIEYQYTVKEALDKDTTAAFNSFLLADNSKNIRVGYKRSGNKHILFKTKSYLRFDHWNISVHSDPIDPFNSKVTKTTVKTDLAICYFKTSQPGKYYYQLSDYIPLITDKMDNIKKFEVQTVRTNNKRVTQDMYDLIIKSTNPEVFLIISNKNNERIVVIK